MKLLKRVLAGLCAIMMVVDICLASCLTVYAREYYRADDVIVEDGQPEMTALNVEETAPAGEEITTQPVETSANETVQNTEAAQETAAGETQTGTVVETDAEQSSSEDTEASTEESKETESEATEETARIELKTSVDGAEITMAGLSTSFPQTENLSISAKYIDSITKVTVEEALEAEADQNNFEVKEFVAYDITLLADGQEIQPTGPVEVTFSGTEVTRNADVQDEDIAVYHIDDQTAVVSDMNGEVTSGGDVVMETTHFSTYAIVKKAAQARATLNFKKVDSKTSEPIGGTEFTLYKQYQSGKLSEKVGEVISDASGQVTFKDLVQGTYYMQETKAAAGYYCSKEIFTLTVEKASGSLKAVLKSSSGAVVESIANHTFDSVVTANKTAKVSNYDDRIYQIDLKAEANIITDSNVEPADIVLVTDISGSMKFPSDLDSTGKIVRIRKDDLNELGGSGPYYVISDPEGTATVYRIWKERNKWYYQDSSNYPTDKGKEEIGNTNAGIQLREEDKRTNRAYWYPVYTDADPEHVRLDYLQSSVNDFIDQLAETSSESRVGLVTFCANVYTPLENELLELNAKNVSRIHGAIDDISTEGGTNQADALDKAAALIKNDNSTRRKVVILITDGAPNGCTESEVETSANKVKNTGATLMTVGLSLNQVVKARELLTGIASEDQNGAKYFFEAETGASLQGVLDSIFVAISDVPLVEGVFRDYINDCFYLVDENGNRLEVGDTAYGGGTVGKDGNGYYIEWPKETIPARPGTTHTISVKAQEDFIGGNVINTNKAGSGLITDDGVVGFGVPSVNVKLLDFTEVDKETTVFLGDTVTPANLIQELANEDIKIIEIVKDADGNPIQVSLPQGSKLTPEEASNLIASGSLEKDYSYAGSNGSVGTFKYTVEAVKPQSNPNLEPHDALEVGEKVEQYVLKVIYTPKTIAERGLGAPNSTEPGAEVTAPIGEKINNYYVNVIAGKLEIIKEVQRTPGSNSAQEFEFEVTKEEDATFKRTVKVTVEGNQTEGRLMLPDDLSRGTYTIKEIASNSDYEFVSISEAEGNKCKVVPGSDEKSISFVVGKDKNDNDSLDTVDTTKTNLQEKYPEGRLAIAKIVNRECSYKLNIHKVSATDGQSPLPEAQFKLQKDGIDVTDGNGNVITATTDKEGNATFTDLKEGTYDIVEIKAPNGFALLDEAYSITLPYEGTGDDKITVDRTMEAAGKTVGCEITVKIENEAIYELPASGGLGIYWYTIGGMLFMMAAALVLYKNKRREVLKR